MLTALCTSY